MNCVTQLWVPNSSEVTYKSSFNSKLAEGWRSRSNSLRRLGVCLPDGMFQIRQVECECASPSWRAFYRELTFHGFHNALGEREAQARAVDLSGGHRRTTIEGLENMRQFPDRCQFRDPKY